MSSTTPTEIASATAVSGRVMPHNARAPAAIARSRTRPEVAQRATPHHAASQARLDGTSDRYIAWKYWTGNEVHQISHASSATGPPAKRRASVNTSAPLIAFMMTTGRPGSPAATPGASNSDVPGGYFDDTAGLRFTYSCSKNCGSGGVGAVNLNRAKSSAWSRYADSSCTTDVRVSEPHTNQVAAPVSTPSTRGVHGASSTASVRAAMRRLRRG